MTLRTVAIHSFKGGTGKSTISANIAALLASRGRRVAVLDLDLEGPGLHVIFNIDPNEFRFTLNDVVRDAASPEQAVVRMNERLGLTKGALYFSPASVKITEMLKTLRTGFEVESLSGALRDLQKGFDLEFLFIDTHPGIENDTLLAMGVCQDLVIVSRMDQQDMFGTGVMVKVAKTLEKPVHLVLNMIPPNLKESGVLTLAQKIGANFKVEVLGWLPFSEDVLGSLSRSVFALALPRHPMTARFNDLASKFERLNGGIQA